MGGPAEIMGYEYTKKSGFKNGLKGLLVRKAKLGEGVIFFGRVKGQYLGFLEMHLPFYYIWWRKASQQVDVGALTSLGVNIAQDPYQPDGLQTAMLAFAPKVSLLIVIFLNCMYENLKV